MTYFEKGRAMRAAEAAVKDGNVREAKVLLKAAGFSDEASEKLLAEYTVNAELAEFTEELCTVIEKAGATPVTLKTETATERDAKWKALYERAVCAMEAAVEEHTPTPMIVEQHENMMDDNSPVKEQWVVSGGVCGFAWVVIKPATCSFVRWLKKQKIGYKHYYGGWAISVSGGGQSMEKKSAGAYAMAVVLNEGGVDAYPQSRID